MTLSAAPVPNVATSNSASARGARTAKVYAWNDTVVLTGTLVKRSVMSAQGGSITVPFLKLDQPISVHDNEGEQLGNYDDESELWYAVEKPPANLFGKHVTYRGTLAPMQTGHHHSNVWLSSGKLLRAP